MKDIFKILDQSPAIRLLASRNRGFIILFFKTYFSDAEEQSVSLERTILELASFIETYKDAINTEEDKELEVGNFEFRAKYLINKWTDQGYLTNYIDEDGLVYLELSSYSQKVLDWLDSLVKRSFVGTESKFKSIIEQLKNLVEFTDEDRSRRLESLKDKRKQIDRQIAALERGEEIFVYEDYQITPRLNQLHQSAKELFTDFKEVEDNFKNITKGIYQKYIDVQQDKDSILAYTFDSLEELKQSDQGKSFYAFYSYLFQNSSQEEWEALVDRLYSKLKEKGITYPDHFLKKLSRYLYRAGKDVFAANDRMAEKLSRIISGSKRKDNQQIRKLFSDIKTHITQSTENPVEDLGLSIEDRFPVHLLTERPLNLDWNEPPLYESSVDLADDDIVQGSSLSTLLAKKSINRKKLRENMRLALKRKPQISLKEIIDQNGGIQQGLEEVIAYLNLLKYYRYEINEEQSWDLHFDNQKEKCIRLPLITLYKDASKR